MTIQEWKWCLGFATAMKILEMSPRYEVAAKDLGQHTRKDGR